MKVSKSIKHDDSRLQELLFLSEEMLGGSLDSAILYGIQARELAANKGEITAEALALKLIGSAYYLKGEYGEAVRNWGTSLALYEELGNKEGIGRLLGNLGVIYNNQGIDSQALEYYLKSNKIAEEIADTLAIISSLNNIGLIYAKKKVTEDVALENYLKALNLSKITSNKEGIGTASQNIGEVYYRQEKMDLALEYFLNARMAYESINSINLPNPLFYLGKVYVAYKDFEKAAKVQKEAYEISSAFGSKQSMARSLIALAQTYSISGNYEQAIKLFKQAIEITTELKLLYEKLEAVRGIANAYQANSDNFNANHYLNDALILNDSIYAERNQMQINRLRVQFEIEGILEEFESIKREQEVRDLKLRQQRIFMLLLFLGLVSTTFFLALLFRLSKQRQKANQILEEQNILITGQKKEITDSIHYASRIQNAVLTPPEDISQILPDHFILYRPRDIVSGDFYWITRIKQRVMCVVADSTGHGVPGAFMSMLGIAFLNEIISRDPDMLANELLNELRSHIIVSLRQKGRSGDSQDGMDLAAMIIDTDKSTLQYAGANNPLLLYRKGELIEYKPDKMPIGFHERADQSFTNHVIDIEKGDVVYAFSDGFPDQFGGPNGKKFMIKNLKKQLIEIHSDPMEDQKQVLEHILESWMADVDQIDDILVMGIRF